MTGAAEGTLLGAAAGLGAWLAFRDPREVRRGMVCAALIGAVAGILIPLLGGRLMGGSLDLLARTFPDSRLRLGPIGATFGVAGFGPVSQLISGACEGALFVACIVRAILIAERNPGLVSPRHDRG
jgi:hypothetical protein